MLEFKGLVFDEEEHKYFVDGVEYPSVSSVLKFFYDEFDKNFVGSRYAGKHGFEYDDVLAAWEGEGDIAANNGTRVHQFGEDYVKWRYFKEGERPKVSCKQCLGVVQFFNSLPPHLVPVVTELRMFTKTYGYAGTCDLLLKDTISGKYYICDYKTNKALFSEYDTAKIKHLDLPLVQNNMGKYSLQFSLYQIPLEERGVNVDGRVLIWLREQEDKKLYKTFRTINATKELKHFINENRSKFAQ